MRQKSFSSLGFDRPHKQTRRERFLAEMDAVVPWAALSALIKPHYPSGERGRPPIGIERMLRIYFLQQWFNMSDPQAEDSLHDSAAMLNFVGIDLGCPSSNDLRPLGGLCNGVSGPSAGSVKLRFVDASSGGAGWFCA